eukprot:4281745-Lingulodinium_polyedra.AAC.1
MTRQSVVNRPQRMVCVRALLPRQLHRGLEDSMTNSSFSYGVVFVNRRTRILVSPICVGRVRFAK